MQFVCALIICDMHSPVLGVVVTNMRHDIIDHFYCVLLSSAQGRQLLSIGVRDLLRFGFEVKVESHHLECLSNG